MWTALVRRVNDIRNPDFLEPPAIEPDRRFGAIAVETRSVFHLMQLAAASIELPAELTASAREYPEPGPAGAMWAKGFALACALIFALPVQAAMSSNPS